MHCLFSPVSTMRSHKEGLHLESSSLISLTRPICVPQLPPSQDHSSNLQAKDASAKPARAPLFSPSAYGPLLHSQIIHRFLWCLDVLELENKMALASLQGQEPCLSSGYPALKPLLLVPRASTVKSSILLEAVMPYGQVNVDPQPDNLFSWSIFSPGWKILLNYIYIYRFIDIIELRSRYLRV